MTGDPQRAVHLPYTVHHFSSHRHCLGIEVGRMARPISEKDCSLLVIGASPGLIPPHSCEGCASPPPAPTRRYLGLLSLRDIGDGTPGEYRAGHYNGQGHPVPGAEGIVPSGFLTRPARRRFQVSELPGALLDAQCLWIEWALGSGFGVLVAISRQ